jgi:hypothetical protein
MLQRSHTRPNVLIPLVSTANSTNNDSVAKTRTQLNRQLTQGKKLPWPPFGSQWYAGCTTLIIGNSLKAGIRASPAICGLADIDVVQDSSRSMLSNRFSRMRTARSRDQGRLLQDLVLGSPNLFSPSLLLRASRPNCELLNYYLSEHF